MQELGQRTGVKSWDTELQSRARRQETGTPQAEVLGGSERLVAIGRDQGTMECAGRTQNSSFLPPRKEHGRKENGRGTPL